MIKLRPHTTNSIFAFLLTVIMSPVFAGEFAVSPMMIEFQGAERSQHDFNFSIYGRSDTKIKLELFDMSQLETGYMGFVKADVENTESMANWVKLEDTSYDVVDGETTTVRGTVSVPARAAGTYLVGVMVEEDIPEEDLGGINVKVRYAVVLNMRVAGSRNGRIKSSFAELVAVEQEDGIYLQGLFNSESTTDEWLSSQVQIRDENNRLVERVELKTESAWQRNDPASRVFPGAQVRVFGKLTEDVVSGNYTVLVRNRFADKSQPVYRDTIRLESRTEDTQKAADVATLDAAIVTEPATVAVEIRGNGTSFSSFFLVNNTDAPVTIDLPESLENLQAQGVKDFQFYPPLVELAPRQKSRIVLKQTHMDSAEYGDIVFTAGLMSEAQELVGDTVKITTIQGGS